MPWIPEMFTASAAAHLAERARRERLLAIPFFDGLLSGDIDALIGSFAGDPELHHLTRGRVKGTGAFARFVDDQREWLIERDAKTEHVDLVVTPNRTVEEVVLHLDGGIEPDRHRRRSRRRRTPDRAPRVLQYLSADRPTRHPPAAAPA